MNPSAAEQGRRGGGGWGRGGRLPVLKIEKGALMFEKKGPDFRHIWVKFPIQNAILRASRRKSS